MHISNHHPAAVELDKEYILIRNLVESFEEKIRAGDDKYGFLLRLKDLRDRIYDFQIQKFGYYIDKQAIPENLPEKEKNLIAQIIDLENRVDHMMKEI